MTVEADAAGLFHQASAGRSPGFLRALAESLRLSDREQTVRAAPAALEHLWRARLVLHARLDQLTAAEIVEARRCFAAVRGFEDLLLEVSAQAEELDADRVKFERQARRPLLDDAPFYDRRSAPGFAFTAMPFRAGDVLLARGPTFLSASVARLSDPPGHFSHLVLLHVDEHGHPRTLESYHHVGLKAYALDFALKNANVRLALLRPNDAALGDASAAALMKVVESARSPIPYDFEQDFDDHSRVSCAEVASWAYELGSHGAVKLPAHRAWVPLQPQLRHQLGLSSAHTFEPQDLEVDPRFSLLAEWRDLRLTRDARHRDAIASAVFAWATSFGYRFHGSPRTTLATNLIWPLRHTPLWPLARALGAPELAPSMPRSLLGTMQQIDEVGHLLLPGLRALDDAHRARTGLPMTPAELRDALDAERPRDAARFSAGERATVHAIFRP